MTKKFCDLTRKFVANVGLNIKKSVLTTKMRVLIIKNRYLTMKLELVLTMKIVDNFVHFGMPYFCTEFWRYSLVPRLSSLSRESLGTGG